MPHRTLIQRSTKGLYSCVTLALALIACPPVFAEVAAQGTPGTPTGEPTAEPTSPESIAARQARVAEETKANSGEIERTDPAAAEHLEAARGRLLRIETLLDQQASLAAPTSPSAGDGPEQEIAPASVVALNALYERQFAAGQDEARRAAELASVREELATAKETLESAERKRREARSDLEKAPAGAQEASRRTLELRQLDARIAQEEVNLLTLQLRVAQRARGAGAADLSERIESMRKDLARGECESVAASGVLTQREAAARRSREAAERRLATTELRLEAAANRLSKQTEPPASLLEEVEALTARRDAIRREIALADAQLERLAAQRKLWQGWEALLRGQLDRDEMESSEAATEERLETLKQAELQRRWRATDLERRLESLDGRLVGILEKSQLRRALEEQREALVGLQRAELAEIASLAADLRLTERYLDDLRERTGSLEPLEYLARGARAAREAWSYEITTIDDAPISVGSMVISLTLFGAGLWASRRGSAIVGRVSEERLKLDPGAAHALQTLSFYALLVGFALMALRAVHFPLTAFTVLGGAAAIGIGFGSQNVMNNFISGLILMLERPVRARDVVEVDGNHGTIEHIGARSTRIRSTDGRQIIVPNSFFLESNVVNWTLSDDLIRTTVSVGVIYGSPTRLVKELIERVVAEEERVLDHPAPLVVFDAFGDNSLNFDVYFWVRARAPMEMRRVQSLVRFAIDDLFREHGLVIAFPQRDVHLDTVSPLEVRVLDRTAPSTQDPGSQPETT